MVTMKHIASCEIVCGIAMVVLGHYVGSVCTFWFGLGIVALGACELIFSKP